jgi:hypothetical protein
MNMHFVEDPTTTKNIGDVLFIRDLCCPSPLPDGGREITI